MTDIEIENKVIKNNIKNIAEKLNIKNKNAKMVLVTAINPTPFGEGKTTVSIGLGDALNKLNKNVLVTLRQPSMGPVFGLKGGATGGGYSQVTPMADINMHFTGDFHAITSANNLLCAAIDNHIFRGNDLEIAEVLFNRCLDVNDRALRKIELEGRKEKFNITAASEIMSIFCLAENLIDLERRLGNIIIGINNKNEFIYAKDLKIEGSLVAIIKDAFYPNLVQTLEKTPVIIHGGPFANIAHGCNSIRATKLSLSLSDYVITEAGFGSDLGAEKFFDIKCRQGNLKPDCVVLVATIKALKYNDNTKENKLENGIINLGAHIENLKKTNSNIVVCLNEYTTDTEEEIELVKDYCKKYNVSFAVSSSFVNGGSGAIDLAKEVLKKVEEKNDFRYVYDINTSIKDKIEKIAQDIYRANKVEYSKLATKKINDLEKKNKSKLPICVAKTQYSLSDDKNRLGLPENYTLHVNDIRLYNGAEFITVLLGDIMTMPGLPKKPNYEQIKLDNNNNIIGIF